MKTSGKWIWAAGLILAAGLAAWAAVHELRAKGGSTEAGPGGPPRAMPVEAVRVKVGPVDRDVQAVGTLAANESVVIRSEISGRVAAIAFSEGQAVARGSVLVQIDPAEYRAQADQIRAVVRLNEMNYERARKLNEEQLISPQAYDEIEARLRESEANLALVEARLDKTTLRAPFSGRLGLRQVSPGDYLQPGQAIVNLEDILSLKVDFRVPELYLGEVKDGQTVKVSVDSFPGKSFTGRIYAVDPRIDEASRTLLLRARIPNPGAELRPGLFARVSLVLDRRPNAILIPEQAIVPTGEAKIVYRVVDGKALPGPVKIGQRTEGQVEIIQGLEPGDTVVTAGQGKLTEGAAVMIVGPGAPPSDGAAPPAPAKP